MKRKIIQLIKEYLAFLHSPLFWFFYVVILIFVYLLTQWITAELNYKTLDPIIIITALGSFSSGYKTIFQKNKIDALSKHSKKSVEYKNDYLTKIEKVAESTIGFSIFSMVLSLYFVKYTDLFNGLHKSPLSTMLLVLGMLLGITLTVLIDYFTEYSINKLLKKLK